MRTRRPRQAPFVLLGASLATAYFASHALLGSHGLLAKDKLIERSGLLEREIAVLEAVRSRLQQDVAALASEPPNPDSVEDAARSALGFVRPGDRIVLPRRN